MGERNRCDRAARRLTRLFRLERRGRFERLSVEVAQQLVDRRGALILQLQECSANLADHRDLDAAFQELATEVDRSRAAAQQRRDDLMREIRFRGRASSGLRGGAIGQLLGRG